MNRRRASRKSGALRGNRGPPQTVRRCRSEEWVAGHHFVLGLGAALISAGEAREAADADAAGGIATEEERHKPLIELVVRQRVQWIDEQRAHARSSDVRVLKQRVQNRVKEAF